jgi:hypothetical protein
MVRSRGPFARRLFRWTEYRAEATRSGLETMVVSRGTDSSNPFPSGAESVPICFRKLTSGTGQGDLAANDHDARIPIMCVVRVYNPRLEPAIKDLVTLAPQICFKFALVHD